MHRRLIAVCLVLLSACAPQAAPTPIAPTLAGASDTPPAHPSPFGPTDTPSVTEPPTVAVAATTIVPVIDTPLTPQPGLIIRGTVQLADGTGLANVSICRNFASYPGTVVAKTDANGNFESAFAFIPGDEMVGVWPLAPGYTFRPESYRWRHYYGSEDRGLDFIATLSGGTAAPPFPCQ